MIRPLILRLKSISKVAIITFRKFPITITRNWDFFLTWTQTSIKTKREASASLLVNQPTMKKTMFKTYVFKTIVHQR